MEYLKQVHDFATKWVDKFRDQKINYIELVDHYMADDCEALGFQRESPASPPPTVPFTVTRKTRRTNTIG